jgi:basic amino acid/polyamine antiporter, APA family
VGSEPDQWGERLPRRLGLLSAVAVVVGSTIGSGIFRTPAVVADRIEVLWLFAAAWILGGAVALAGALTYAELSAMMPRSGGVYVYLREALGPLWAFLFGWAQLLVLRPAAYGAISITSAEYLWRLAGEDGTQVLFGPLSGAQITAAALVVVVAVVNYRGIQLGAVIQNVSTVLKVAALLVLVGLGVWWGLAGIGHVDVASSPVAVPEMTLVSAFGLAMVPVLWSYDGWSDVGFIGGEVRDPQRTLPRAFLAGTGLVAGLYLLVNAAYLMVVPLEQMPGSKLIAADVAEAVLGGLGVVFVSGAVALSTFGTLNGSMMTGPRIFYAMAEDRLFFRRFARVQPRHGTPGAAIVLSAILGVIFVSIRTFSELADQFVIGIWPFYALGVLSVFVLRHKRPDAERPYRAWGYPWVPALFLIAALFLLGNYLVSKPWLFLANLGVIATGVPVFWAWRRRNAAEPRR